MKKRKKTNKKFGRDFENKVQKTLNSGALWFDKGDLKTDEYLIECKVTDKKGYRISDKLLKKIWDEALDRNKLPMLVIGIKGENYRWIVKAVVEKEV